MQVQCSLNISEGRRKEVIEALASAVSGVDGITVLEVDPSPSSNRTVLSFAGPPDAAIEAAMMGARASAQLIDMTRHRGDHPRLGAIDACPFIPVKNATVEDCVHCAKIFASKLAEELSVPVYLYGDASPEGEKRTVQELRRGEYESLPARFGQEKGDDATKEASKEFTSVAPDYGPAEFVPPWGATLVGARKFVVSYSVNLLCTKEVAQELAKSITEGPNALKEVQAVGWFIDEHNVAQVTTNITDPDASGLHDVFEAVSREAKALRVAVIGSQVVGVIPLKPLIDAADFYAKEGDLFILEETQKLRLAIQRLGLNSLGEFNPKEKIIDFMCEEALSDGPLVSQDLRNLVTLFSSRTESPGAGSAAAIVGAVGASLCTMAGLFSSGEKRFEASEGAVREALPGCYAAIKELLSMTDEDAAAHSDYKKVCSLSAEGEEEAASKAELQQRLLRRRLAVPLAMIRQLAEVAPLAAALAPTAALEYRAELLTALRCLESAVWGGRYTVQSLVADLDDKEAREKMLKESNEMTEKSLADLCEAVKALAARQ